MKTPQWRQETFAAIFFLANNSYLCNVQLDPLNDIATDILSQYWGYESFRPMQREIITSVLAGRDTLGLLPTGGGKSITFQIPALAMDGLTIVVTPLISLMKDQVDNLRERGIKATHLHSGLSRSEHRLALDRCRLGRVKLLYLSPEKLQSHNFLEQLRLMNVSLIVVDEAHCISQWGYDFRPSYLRINALRDIFPQAPVLALTASATPEVADDIMRLLRFKERNLFALSFSRPNISYIVRQCDHKEQKVIDILDAVPGTAIIYVRSRKRTREIAASLQKAGISADFYHAGLAPEDKDEKQNRWKQGTTRVMVATNAFGMGIDKPDVRVVIHHDLPSSLEEYYQEAGRAGRDGRPAFAVIIASHNDKGVLTRLLNESFPPKDYISRIYELAGNFLDVAVGDGYNNLYEFNFNLFCQRFKLAPIPALSSLSLLTQAGYIDFTDEITTRSRVMVLLNKSQLYSLDLSGDTDRVFQLLLRTYSGLFADYVYISEPLIASRLNVSEETVYKSLLALSRIHAIHYVPKKSTPYILYTTSREEPRYIALPRTVYEQQRDRLKRRLEAMKAFTFSTDECRVNIMLRYFGEQPAQPCGKCDICRDNRRNPRTTDDTSQLSESIIYLASQPGGHEIDYILSQMSQPREKIISLIRQLIDRGDLTLNGSYLSVNER